MADDFIKFTPESGESVTLSLPSDDPDKPLITFEAKRVPVQFFRISSPPKVPWYKPWVEIKRKRNTFRYMRVNTVGARWWRPWYFIDIKAKTRFYAWDREMAIELRGRHRNHHHHRFLVHAECSCGRVLNTWTGHGDMSKASCKVCGKTGCVLDRPW